MSRSYKRNLVCKDKQAHKAGKKSASRRVRRAINRVDDEDQLLPKGGETRKMTESWDICDYKFGPYTHAELMEMAEGDKREERKMLSIYRNK